MSGGLPFAKLHGLGNDYVFVAAEDVAGCAVPLPELARWVSDRHLGVGSDGLIIVGRRPAGAISMRMFNADGSESGMCGNGVRCAARFAVERGMSDASPLDVVTPERTVCVSWRREPHGSVERASVDMGLPELACARIPAAVPHVDGAAQVVAHALPGEALEALGLSLPWTRDAGLACAVTLVSMGNPHAVLFCEDVEAVPLEAFGPLLERWSWFPRRTNVHVAQAEARDVRNGLASHWRMRTWERGAGITQACGSGACAVCVAGVLEGRGERRVAIDLPGGRLELEWRGDGGVQMEGPCTAAFEGTLDLAAMEPWSARARGGGRRVLA